MLFTTFPCSFVITYVYFVPELIKNLLSVSKISIYGFKAVFDDLGTTIYTKHQKLLMIGDDMRSLYIVYIVVKAPERNYILSESKSEVAHLWHQC